MNATMLKTFVQVLVSKQNIFCRTALQWCSSDLTLKLFTLYKVIIFATLFIMEAKLNVLLSVENRNVLYYYVFINIVAFVVYYYDKQQSKIKGRFRDFSTNNLHCLSLIGGWIGAGIAMIYCRHKTSQIVFQITYLIMLVLNIIIVYKLRVGKKISLLWM